MRFPVGYLRRRPFVAWKESQLWACVLCDRMLWFLYFRQSAQGKKQMFRGRVLVIISAELCSLWIFGPWEYQSIEASFMILQQAVDLFLCNFERSM